MHGNSDDILRALDAFIRKYYKNIAVRGVLCAIGIVATIFLCAVLLEHIGWLPTQGRALLFWGGVGSLLLVTAAMVVRPLLKMMGLGRRISRAEAARIVGRHFSEVDDRLLNLLQLVDNESEECDGGQAQLLLAAIEQKTAQLRPIPLLNAIDLKANRRYLKYALPPLAVIALLLLFAPRAVVDPTRRIAHYRTVYERPAPFVFRVMNESLTAVQGEDYTLHVSTEGEARPDEVWLCVGDRRYKMADEGGGFLYTFKKLHSTQRFVMEGGGVSSGDVELTVVPKPMVVGFRMMLDYPAYTGRDDETLVDQGDAAVPEGTTVRWLFTLNDADTLLFLTDGAVETLPVGRSGRAEKRIRVVKDMGYAFCAVAQRKEFGRQATDTLHYTLSAIADAMPQISVDEVVDSIHPDRRLFHGRIKDDYGFSRLVFVHSVCNSADTSEKARGEAEMALQGGAAQEFFFSFNTAELHLAPGDELNYWFAVSDNDAIHGSKTTRSRMFEISVPTEEELDSMMDVSSREMRSSADEQMGELRKMQDEINEMMQRMLDKKELGWQDRKELEQLASKQRQVRQMMQQMQQQIRENNRMEQKYREQSEQLLEKQRELDRLMNDVMDEKMKQTLAEIDRMMQELDKKKVQQELEQLKLDNAELEQQLDQNIELMKRLELEKKVEQTVQKMDKLAADQRELGQQTMDADKSQRELLQEKQSALNERFGKLEKEIEQIKEGYKELDPGAEFNVPQDLQQKVENEQQNAGQQLRKGKHAEAGQMQKQAADDMERLGEAIAQAQVEMEQQGLAEDAEQVRQLLKNLVRLSFNQEELIADLGSIYIQDPRYQTIIARQNRIKDDFRGVEDSLRAVAKRQVQVAAAVGKDIGEVNSSIARSLKGLLDMNQSFYGNYKNTQAARSMQYGMTSLNNLALVLAESLDKMQGQMRSNSQKMKGGQCKNTGKGNSQSSKPGQGKGKASASTMKQLQQELNRQMDALRKQMEQQGGSQGGRHQLGQGQQMSEELARMAAQQEAIRRMMQQYGQEMKETSGGNAKLAREIDQMIKQMEQTETELVNRTITRQTMQRQQQIMTRLLEHEKAEMQREREERRESHEASDLYGQPSPSEIQKYNRQMVPAEDQLRSVPPTLQPYYRKKVNDYFFRQ